MCEVEYTTSTQGDTMTDTFVWTVPKFLDILNKESTRELRINKPRSVADDWSGLRFHIKMRFLGREKDTIEICYLSLIRLILKSELSIRSNAVYQRDLETQVNYINEGYQWQHLGTILKRDIVNNKDSFLKKTSGAPNDGTLCLIIKFTILHTKYESCFINIEGSKDTDIQLSHNFGQLFIRGLFSDVTMKSVEGNEYKVHKAVLASRSVVLKSFFEHNTKECQTNIIESHFEAEVLKEVLTFIYSNKAPRVDEIAEKLLAAADFYQLRRLKYLCVEAVAKKLTAENAEETQELANMNIVENLNKLALE